jgi:hypothetical protein
LVIVERAATRRWSGTCLRRLAALDKRIEALSVLRERLVAELLSRT